MRALLLLALLTVAAGCKKKEEESSGGGGSGGVAAPLDSAGTIRASDVIDEWHAVGANRAKIKQKYFDKRWTIDLADGSYRIESDRIEFATFYGNWVTTRIEFRNPKELAALEPGRLRLNALCRDEVTFADAVVVKWTVAELKERDKQKRANALKNQIATKKQKARECQSHIARYTAGGAVFEGGSRLSADQIRTRLEAAQAEKAKLEEEIQHLEAEVKSIETN